MKTKETHEPMRTGSADTARGLFEAGSGAEIKKALRVGVIP